MENELNLVDEIEILRQRVELLITQIQSPKEVFNTKDGAKFLGVSARYLNMIANDGLIRHKIINAKGEKLFKREWLLEWLEQ